MNRDRVTSLQCGDRVRLAGRVHLVAEVDRSRASVVVLWVCGERWREFVAYRFPTTARVWVEARATLNADQVDAVLDALAFVSLTADETACDAVQPTACQAALVDAVIAGTGEDSTEEQTLPRLHRLP